MFPLGYLGFALVRGLIVDRYPYPFIDAGELGYDGVAVSAVGFATVFWLLGLLFVGVDRLLARAGRTGPAKPGAVEPPAAAGPAEPPVVQRRPPARRERHGGSGGAPRRLARA
ncbi:Pr6Pr family membrane protein [Micromonospora sp. BRA006-A]|nr:Pr6Pr family membrane protein [Micromonospora sp. BRA006-A]